MHTTIRGLQIGLIAACFASAAPADEPKAKPAADSMLGAQAGQVRDDNGLKMKLVWCPPGAVRMVDDWESEIRQVAPVNAFLTSGYWLGKYELTQAEWKEVMATEPWKGNSTTKEGDDFPATWVSWEDAMEFCAKLTKRERRAARVPDGWEYGLPTEAQWERACRARSESFFSFGDDRAKLGEYAWFDGNAFKTQERFPHRVGQKKSNPWGLHDMHGNVWEWCRDYYAEKLPGGRDPVGDKEGALCVIRGGSWLNLERDCGSGRRASKATSEKLHSIGFRVALTSVRPASDNPAK